MSPVASARSPLLGPVTVLLFVALGVGLYLHARRLPAPVSGPVRPVQQVTLVQPLAPPPPLEVPAAPPLPAPPLPTEPAAEKSPAPSPADDLVGGIEGPAGSDAFGLSRGSGATIVGGNGRGAYVVALQQALRRHLMREPALRRAAYRLVLRVDIDAAGRVRGGELVQGSGDAAIDREVLAALRDGVPLERAPPPGFPTRLTLEISSRS